MRDFDRSFRFQVSNSAGEALADANHAGAADLRLVTEDLVRHGLDVAVRQHAHPAGDDEGLERVRPIHARSEELVAQCRVGVAQLRAPQLLGPKVVLMVRGG